MRLHIKTNGGDRKEQKEDILVPTPSETDPKGEPLSLPSLHKVANLYRLPIQLTCHPQEANADKLLKLKNLESFMVNITICGKNMTQRMFHLRASINIMAYLVYL